VSEAAFLSELRRLDIRVWVEGDKLRCNAPAGALTDELREQLRQRKNDIVSFLHMADTVAAQQSAIVPLQQDGAKAPVFGVPAHTGDVFCYRALAQALGDERPFFALQPPGLDGRSQPFTRVEDLAAYFVRQIRAFRPHGPWIVAGYCMGGTVAIELAQQLLAGGESAGFLAMFGVPYPVFFHPLSLLRHRIGVRVQLWRRRAGILAAQSSRERLEYFVWRLGSKEPPDPAILLRARFEAATLSAVRAYEPRPFPGRVHHFFPCEAWPLRSRAQAQRWRSLAARVETSSGPDGCTADDMLLAQYAPIFAEQFRRSCARAGM
jgi:thioesterase domain-containing protein